MLGYTQSIKENYQSYIKQIAWETKDKIENMSEDATPEEWNHALGEIGEEYTCSARFFLMSYLFEQADEVFEDSQSYLFTYAGKEYFFHTVTAKYAQTLPEEERNQYIKLLTMIAADNHQEDSIVWKPLIWKAMLRNKKLELLTREEGFRLAHGLRFNLQQTEKFLLCVLENDGFCYTRSEDLIEAFCFLHQPNNNYHTALRLKEKYAQISANIAKQDVEVNYSAIELPSIRYT